MTNLKYYQGECLQRAVDFFLCNFFSGGGCLRESKEKVLSINSLLQFEPCCLHRQKLLHREEKWMIKEKHTTSLKYHFSELGSNLKALKW